MLERTVFTDAKSEIKWMEAAMLGIPSVVTDTATHRRVIEDGRTGFLASDTDGFVDALDRLVSDHGLRARVGAAARDRVLTDYTLAAMGQSLKSAFGVMADTMARSVTGPVTGSVTGTGPDTGTAAPAIRRIRLLIVHVFYPPQATGGATRVVHDNVRHLQQVYGHRFEIDVICTLEGGQTPFEITTHAREGVRIWTITAPLHPMGDMEPRDPAMGRVFERLLDRLRPDLVHFHCVQRLTAAVVDVVRLREIPYLITLHDGWWISPNHFIVDRHDTPEYYDYTKLDTDVCPARARALARPLRGAARLLAVSDSFAELHRACGLDNVTTCENGVSALPACPRQRAPDGRVRLAHIGGASRHKGIHLVRNALLAHDFDNLHLLLIDHAMSSGAIRNETWGTTPVTITGKIAQQDVARLYARIDILLAPSVWPEAYGLVAREALATGAWVIASRSGAMGDDIIEGVNGHCIDVSSYRGMVDILTRVDADPDRYRQPPERETPMRTATEQVAELIPIYDAVLAEASDTPRVDATDHGRAAPKPTAPHKE